jgi:hypothetical protein
MVPVERTINTCTTHLGLGHFGLLALGRTASAATIGVNALGCATTDTSGRHTGEGRRHTVNRILHKWIESELKRGSIFYDGEKRPRDGELVNGAGPTSELGAISHLCSNLGPAVSCRAYFEEKGVKM